MKKSSERLISGLLLAAVCIVAANAWLAFHAEDVLAQSEYWVVHTYQAINSVQTVLNAVEDMETGARGYLLTSDPVYLAPYREAKGRVTQELTNFEQTTIDNPRQQAHASQLRQLSKERIAFLEQGIQRQQSGHRDGAMDLVREGAGRSEMSALRATVGSMQQEEYRLLAARQHESANARTEARLTVALASALDILFIVFAVYSLRRERQLREKTRETADNLEKLLYVSDVAMARLSLADLTAEMLLRLKTVAGADAIALYKNIDQEEDVPNPEDAGKVTVLASFGVDLKIGQTVALRPSGPLATARQRDEIVRLTGPEVQELYAPELARGIGTLLILPLTAQGLNIGLIVAGYNEAGDVAPAQEKLLRVAADRMAGAMDRAALLEREQEARQLAEKHATAVLELNAELEERVRKRTAELETTNRELEAFSYSVSHDLRAPLRSVDGLSVALEEDYGELLQGEGRHFLNRIRSGVQRMGQLIDALLQLSRITRAELALENVDLTAMASGAADDLVNANPDRVLHFHIEDGLRCEGDPRLLRIIFENMFANAVKFTARKPEAEIGFGWSAERKAYFIRDNGAGFDQQYAGKLFVAFQRLHGEKDFQGSGIGLATVARVIRRHHGTITAEGVVEQGATFWFTLA